MLGDKFGRSDVIEIFPRKIGSYIFPRKYEKRLKNVCFNIIDNRVHAIDNNDVHLTHYFDPIQGNKTLLEYPGFEAFHGWIKGCSIDYINNTLGLKCENVVITTCWMNECSKGGFQVPHNHTNSVISGTYYVNFVHGMHAPINFINPETIPLNKTSPYLHLESNNNNEVSIEPNEGQLLLWESHLGHTYRLNNADKRVSISFNVMPETIPGFYNFKIAKVTS